MPTNVISGVRDLGVLGYSSVPAFAGVLGYLPVPASDFVSYANTSDFFRFSLTNPGNINLALTGLSADVDVRIIRDVNSNGIVDAGDEIVRSSLGGTANEIINFNNQAAGNYFAQVYTDAQYRGNINYTLRLSNASTSDLLSSESDLGALSSAATTQSGFVGDLDTSDFFRFSLTSPSNINLTLTGLSADADVRIIRDANNNGVVDRDEVVASSSRRGTVDESINLNNQAAGNYFAQVSQSSGNSTYALRLSNARTNNLLSSERIGGKLVGISEVITYLSKSNTSDIYKFSLTSASNLNLSLTVLEASTLVRIIRDANNNGVVDAGEIVYTTEGMALGAFDRDFETSNRLIGVYNRAINLSNVAAGDYYAQVYNNSPVVNEFNQNGYVNGYVYRIDNNSMRRLIAAEYEAGTLPIIPFSAFGSLDNSNASDIYQFALTNADNINVSLTGLSADANMRIIRDTNNNGMVDAGEVVASSVLNGTANESINLNDQAAGTYLVHVYQGSSSQATSYKLNLSSAVTSNLLSSERTLFLGAGIAVNLGFVGNSDTSDIYRFTLSSARTVTARLGGLSADADLRIIRDANNNGMVDAGEVVGTSNRAGTSVDVISSFLGAGDYFVQVHQFSGDTSYNLAVSG